MYRLAPSMVVAVSICDHVAGAEMGVVDLDRGR